ncbi:MAG: hypothetical protein HDQ97_10090 [Lachnospiraceae bacterium]|nr:hypothetical protein [Lachnospiraceae bacterium]
MENMKICIHCKKLMSYNSYFGGYYCAFCGELEIKPQSYSFGRQNTVRARKLASNKKTVLAK